MSAEILMAVAEANVAAGAAICAVLAIRKSARRLFGARIAYGLWLAAPLAAAASLLPARTVVIPYAMPVEPVADVVAAGPVVMTAIESAPFDGNAALIATWLAGAGISFALLAWRQSRFMTSLGGVVRDGKFLRAGSDGVGPAVLGALFPRIVLPADFETRYDAREQTVVLAHETAHLKSGDAAVNALTALAQCLFWFNPLIHIAARALRVDQELACDAAVLAAHPAERRVYGEALLKTQLTATPLPLGCYWPAGASHPLKERIAMLKFQAPSRARRLGGGVGVLALCLGAGFAAWASQPAQIAVTSAPVGPAAPEAPADAAVRFAEGVTTKAETKPMEAVMKRPLPTTDTASASPEASGETVTTSSGRIFQRTNAQPIERRIDAIVVVTADGRTQSIMLPLSMRPDWPAPVSVARSMGLPMEAEEPEPENVTEARRTLATAKEEEDARVARGDLPQKLTPKLGAAFTIVSSFDRMQSLKRQAATQMALLKEVQRLRTLAREKGIDTTIR